MPGWLRKARGGQPPIGVDLWFRTEKVSGKGEDARPFARRTPAGGTVAVCDGLGGAGAALVPGLGRRQAAVAAELAAQVVAEAWDGDDPEPDPQRLADLLAARFASRSRGLELAESRIRSKLLKTLPTTLALGWYRTGGDGLRCGAVWAGDSRVYLLTAERGLQQLSTDDLASDGDARANLRDDAQLSNMITASAPVRLSTRTVRLRRAPAAAALIAATDGCFAYLPTPTHFEHLLLRELALAQDFPDWIDRVEMAVAAVSGDDASMAVAIVRPGGFAAFWRAVRGRYEAVRQQIEELTRLGDAHQNLVAAAERARQAYEACEAELWESYRDRYEGLWKRHPRESVLARGEGDT